MVIYDGDFGRTGFRPAKHHTPLVVDANGVKPAEISLEWLQAIAGRSYEVGQFSGAVELEEFSQGDSGDGRKAAVLFVAEKLLGVRVGEGLDHGLGWL